ncbi:hypothetical protein [Planktothrix phage Pra-JY27]|nr:holin family protein [Planktothrix phage Pag-Yong1]WEV89203.1 holin family protein [Synechococcus phage MinM2]
MSQFHDYGKIALDAAVASVAAGIAAYVRLQEKARPLTLASFVAGTAEAVVCGLLALGVAKLMDWNDPVSMVAVAAFIGRMGSGAITDALMAYSQRKLAK